MAALRDSLIDESPTSTKLLTKRFNRVETTQQPPQAIEDFLDRLHDRCRWQWALSKPELLAGHPNFPATAREIALWIQP